MFGKKKDEAEGEGETAEPKDDTASENDEKSE
jgi:hypothetical protein